MIHPELSTPTLDSINDSIRRKILRHDSNGVHGSDPLDVLGSNNLIQGLDGSEA